MVTNYYIEVTRSFFLICKKMSLTLKRKNFSDPDQEYIYFMGSETLPSACYIHSDESSIPIYSTSNGYNKRRMTP